MFEHTLKIIRPEVSGERAFRHVEEVVRHHRIQASPGFRDAANYCLQAFRKIGVEAVLESYPASFSSRHWSQLMFQEWSCEKAELHLLEPEAKLLASYDECKISVIQRSMSTPQGGVTAELVVLDRGDGPEAYADVDLQGKLVLTDGDLNKVHSWAVLTKGAMGIVSDRLAEVPLVRERHDLPDARQYTSFWWTEPNPVGFGFVLSPRLGDYLRKQAATARAVGKPVLLHAEVVSSLYDGEVENVSAFVPGQTEEEVLVVAHLCHPQWCANDNASGVAVAMEVARAIDKLVREGKLPRPRRGIRFLLMAEFTGTYAYLDHHHDRLPRTLAGLNLDMVGEKQELTKGPLVVEHPPEATESFVGDFMEAVLGAVAREVQNNSKTKSYALFKHTATPFSGGSDHYILSDPTVGIPCPMLIQWPDKFYHTSADTLDKVDPEMMERVAAMAATYIFTLADADYPFAVRMLGESRLQFEKTVGAYLQEALGSQEALPMDAIKRRLDFWCARKASQMESLRAFVTYNREDFAAVLLQAQDSLSDAVAGAWQRFHASVDALRLPVAAPGEVDQPEGAELVPVRIYPGPLSLRGHAERLSGPERESYEGLSQKFGADALRTATCALYWADGKRNIADICSLVEMELGTTNVKFMVEYMKSLQAMQLIDLK